jgi:hypothetical protein
LALGTKKLWRKQFDERHLISSGCQVDMHDIEEVRVRLEQGGLSGCPATSEHQSSAFG